MPLSTHCCPGLASRGDQPDLAGSNPGTSWHGHDPTHCMPEAGPALFQGSRCSGHGRTSTNTGTCISDHQQAPAHRCKLSCPESCSLMEHICEQKPDTMPQGDAPCHPGLHTCGLSGPGQGHQQGRRWRQRRRQRPLPSLANFDRECETLTRIDRHAGAQRRRRIATQASIIRNAFP